jgi:hypothetical protein
MRLSFRRFLHQHRHAIAAELDVPARAAFQRVDMGGKFTLHLAAVAAEASQLAGFSPK